MADRRENKVRSGQMRPDVIGMKRIIDPANVHFQ